MHVDLKQEPNGVAFLTIELTHDELVPHLQSAATKLSEHMKIEGFRPGHAPYDIVKQRAGVMAVYEAGAERAVHATYPEALKEKSIEPAGQPSVDITKLAPENSFIYTARVPVMPTVTLGDYTTLPFTDKSAAITDADVQKTIDELRTMRMTEVVVDRAATKEDKIVVDMEMFLDRVPLDGGQTKNHSIFLSEAYYVPGLPEQLIGAKKGDTKEFELPFPKTHHQKNIAGKKVKFRIKVNDVFALTRPEVNDAFASVLGQKTVADLHALIRKNLAEEATRKERDRQDAALIDALIKRSTFGDVPGVLLTRETDQMVQELQSNIERQGGTFDQYLEAVKKTREQLALDMAPKAVERVKGALVLRTLAEKESITVSDEELEQEMQAIRRVYAGDPEAEKHLASKATRDSIRGIVRNRKAIALLREKAIPVKKV